MGLSANSLLTPDLPSPGDTHLWFVPQDPCSLERLHADGQATLSRQEAERFHSFRSHQRALRFLTGRNFTRRVLAGYLGTDPAELVFEEGQNGRPALARPRTAGVSFSLSHASDRTVLAISSGSTIGVDLEPVSRAKKAWRISQNFFPASERRDVAEAEDSAALHALMHWCLKESIAKARGDTVWANLAAVTLRLKCGHIDCRFNKLVSGTWSLACGAIERNFIIAVAQVSPSNRSRSPGSVTLLRHEERGIVHTPFNPEFNGA